MPVLGFFGTESAAVLLNPTSSDFAMGSDQLAFENQDQQEIQGLVCNDVLRDWLNLLEHEAEDGQRLAAAGADRQADLPQQ